MQLQKIGATAGTLATSPLTTGSGGGGIAVAAVDRLAGVGRAAAAPQPPTQQQQAVPLEATPSPFLEPGLQQQVAAGQQAQAWAEQMDRQLQGLKESLAGLLGGKGSPAEASLALQQARAGWQQRSTQAGGLVDGQLLVHDGPGQARQLFTLRGLDAAALVQDGAETLSFAVPGSAVAINVAIEPEQGAHAAAQRLDQAMAPAGLRVALAAGGSVVWSADEAQWPALRDGVAVKGEGRRFPSGQRVRVRLDALPDAVQPGGWSLDGTAAQRQTLARVIAAQAQLREAAAQLGRRQDAARLPAADDAAVQGPLLLGLAEDFKARGRGEPSYEHVAALRGIRREQVRALLGR